jgi:hypothetical protein
MRKAGTNIALAAVLVTIMGAVLAGGQAPQAKSDTFTWAGEFVGLDASARTMTVKSRVAYPEAVAELKNFKAGDRVWILWSGVHDYSDAVRQVRRPATSGKIDDDLVLPAELVSTEAPNQYITIRVKVQERSLSALTSVKPGDWVTVTSRHRPSGADDAVEAVRPYGSPTSTK